MTEISNESRSTLTISETCRKALAAAGLTLEGVAATNVGWMRDECRHVQREDKWPEDEIRCPIMLDKDRSSETTVSIVCRQDICMDHLDLDVVMHATATEVNKIAGLPGDQVHRSP